MSNPNLSTYLTEARQSLTSGEVYQDLVDEQVIPPCPTTVTESTMDAIFYQALGETQAAEEAYQNAATFTSPHGDPEVRANWLRGVMDSL